MTSKINTNSIYNYMIIKVQAGSILAMGSFCILDAIIGGKMLLVWERRHFVNQLGETTPETNEIVTLICSCHNFFSLFCANTFYTELVAYCVCFKMIYKKSIRHLFLEDISKHARVTQEMALPNLWQVFKPGALTAAPQTRYECS